MKRPGPTSRSRAATLAALMLLGCATAVSAQESGGRDSLTLAEAVVLAQETHPSVRAARAGEDAASAAIGQAKSAWYPYLGVGASLTQYEKPMIVAPIHSFQPDEFPGFDRTILNGNLSMAWTVFDGGARRARVKSARAGAAAAESGVISTEQVLTTRVTINYLEVLTARGVLDAVNRSIGAFQAERRRVDLLLSEGRAAQVELLRVDAALAEAEAERVAAEARLDLAERELARMIDLPLEDTRSERLRAVRLADSATLAKRADLVRRALANNPELELSRQQVAAAEAENRLAKAAWWPAIDVFGAVLAFGSSEGDGTAEWQAGIGLSYPLFTGGARSSAVSRTNAQTRMALEELRLAELQAQDNVDRAVNAALRAEAVVESLSQAVQHQAEVVRIEQLSLDAGAGTQTDYLRAEANLLRASSMLVQARHTDIAARVELARVVGELTPDWLDRNVEIAR